MPLNTEAKIIWQAQWA